MTYQHTQLANGRWVLLLFAHQMANIGSEVERAISWRNKGNREYSLQALYRALELISFTIDAHVTERGSLRELTRLREILNDYLFGENVYRSTDQQWHAYFMAFNKVARQAS